MSPKDQSFIAHVAYDSASRVARAPVPLRYVAGNQGFTPEPSTQGQSGSSGSPPSLLSPAVAPLLLLPLLHHLPLCFSLAASASRVTPLAHSCWPLLHQPTSPCTVPRGLKLALPQTSVVSNKPARVDPVLPTRSQTTAGYTALGEMGCRANATKTDCLADEPTTCHRLLSCRVYRAESTGCDCV